MQVLVRIVDLKNKAVNYFTRKNRFIREQSGIAIRDK